MWREARILLIDDNLERRQQLAIILDFLGESYLACSVASWQGEVAALPSTEALLCVLLGELAESGKAAELLGRFEQLDACLPVLVIGGTQTAEWPDSSRQRLLCTVAMPFSYNNLLDSLHRAQVYREMHDQTRGRGQHRELNLFRSLVGTSRAVQQLRQMLQKVADTQANVLIVGESGTGKEVVARNLHYHSARKDSAFVPVNCAAIAAELLESELFGHEKGAFVGALSTRAGRFEMASGGTLFLDEVAELPELIQLKVLHVLREGSLTRVGGDQAHAVDVRIIAASSSNLEERVATGQFSNELFYQLNVFPLEIPPLRERIEDIPLLLNELISRLEHEKRGSIRFNSAAIMSICRHSWPGNVRELANLVERMAILHPYGVIGVPELPVKLRYVDDESTPHLGIQREVPSDSDLIGEALKGSLFTANMLLPAEGLDLKDYLATLERGLIQQAIDDADGVVARAAERLRIRRTTLVEKMRKYGMSRREDDLQDDED
jgi:sigma-54 specific flagellar transcriptional regulator A